MEAHLGQICLTYALEILGLAVVGKWQGTDVLDSGWELWCGAVLSYPLRQECSPTGSQLPCLPLWKNMSYFPWEAATRIMWDRQSYVWILIPSPRFLYLNLINNVIVLGSGTFGYLKHTHTHTHPSGRPWHLLPCEDEVRRNYRCQTWQCLHISFPASKAIESEFLLFIQHLVCGILLQSYVMLRYQQIWQKSVSGERHC